mmetsp:Transcript_29771/g.71658  ORF Transcript_29771/g.71658 Transcript_29771/m.71658 type:complete len:168 (+) Transcript_29771:3-506(+)
MNEAFRVDNHSHNHRHAKRKLSITLFLSHHSSIASALSLSLHFNFEPSFHTKKNHHQSPKIPNTASAKLDKKTITFNHKNINLITIHMSDTSSTNNEYHYLSGGILLNYDQQVIYTIGVQPLEPLSDELLSKRWQQESLRETETPSRRTSDNSVQAKFVRNALLEKA